MRTSRLLAILSLTSALAGFGQVTPAQAAFEFLNKATPAKAQPTPTAASVPVTKTDDVAISDLAKEPTTPVWTPKAAPTKTNDIPLTPIVSNSDSLQVLDGPLLPDENDALPMPVAAPVKPLPPITASMPTSTSKPTLPPVSAKRQVLADSTGMSDAVATNKPAATPSIRDAMLWDKPPAPVKTSSDPILAGMTTDKSAMGKPLATTLPPADAPMSLTAEPSAKPMAEPQPTTAKDDKAIEIADLAPSDEPILPVVKGPQAAPAPIIETIMDPAPPTAPADDAVIQGFGSNLPLVMALRQIVPPNYRFSFAPDVNQGQRVSWQGGKNWSQVVTDTAAKNGLMAEISGNVVAIRKVGSPSSISTMDDVVMGATAPVTLTQPNPTQPAPLLPLAKAPLSLADDTNDLPPVTATPSSKPLPLAPMDKTPVLNKDIAVDEIKPAPVMPAPVVEDKKGALKPPPAAPLATTLEDTKDVQAVATAKADTTASLTADQDWIGHSGQSLRAVLQDWSKAADVSLVWSSDFDYPLQTDIRIHGNYPDAVRTLLAGFGKAQPKPIGRLHSNAGVGAQPVLIVDTPRLVKG